ncbi:MAG TPA: Fur family transcriptional regulator [Solirubrobacteraceae bacterium]|nr:Fur family transcriptional regulator [Solirubrobacteraceae bacterium]
MTQSPNAPPLAFTDLADAIGALRNAGLRISTPRRLVLEALFAATGPVSAGDLARELSLDESSVYRNLEVLEQLGVVRHVHLGHSAGLYTLVSDEVVEYLCCERCGKVTTVPPARLDTIRDQIRDEFGYTARFTHFAIVGVCPDCAAESQSEALQSPDASGRASHAHRHVHKDDAGRRPS